MLRSLAPRLAAPVTRQTRLYSAQLSAASPATSAALPYRVLRNSRGSIPVYTDIRNGGTRYQVLIRNVEGNVDALAHDLKTSLFPAGSHEAERMRVETNRQRHVVLSGGRWKPDVLRWLAQHGF
ncbi:hypothetical protein C2E23DRAFT_884208 [Lenzites betulinus]|nr:hypothetical protein C2E23DRAFT_884208 [Lenzites betulinus]